MEIKLRVEKPEQVRRALQSAGGRRITRVHERNTLLDTADSRLAREGKLLRVRWNGRRAMLTFKAPAAGGSGTYKVRRELESPLGDPELMMKVLAGLGFRPRFRYEKYRTSFRLRGLPRLHVEWDETPIGVFLELEGPPRAIDAAARRLGFARKDYVTANYLLLYRQECAKRGVKPGDMLFAKKKRRKAR